VSRALALAVILALALPALAEACATPGSAAMACCEGASPAECGQAGAADMTAACCPMEPSSGDGVAALFASVPGSGREDRALLGSASCALLLAPLADPSRARARAPQHVAAPRPQRVLLRTAVLRI
jgi:hypothetical protein